MYIRMFQFILNFSLLKPTKYGKNKIGQYYANS